MKRFTLSALISLSLNFWMLTGVFAQHTYHIDADQTYILAEQFTPAVVGGDTIKISADRTKTLQFKDFEGNADKPIVFINEGGQVHINTTKWGALRFVNCKYIKVSGRGDANFHYGFKLQAHTSGLSFEQYSSDCEAENIEIEGSGETFFGIYAKKDFTGNPPFPYPVFKNLIIHDNYIHDLAEGMYLGETTAPAMEFRHMRVFNNVIENTLRESLQIANSVEDIEIYNNFLHNTGIQDLPTQNNNLQIGINSIAKVYNNIIIKSNAYGIIVLGDGDVNMNNNFIQDSKGVFIDNRYISLPFAPVTMDGNFLSQVNNSKIVENLDEKNDIILTNNFYSPDSLFFKNSVSTKADIVLSNNVSTTIADFKYTLVNGIFENSPENPAAYQEMGPKQGLSYEFNATPILDSIPNVLILNSDSLTLDLSASVADNDQLHFEGKNLPAFIQLVEMESGHAKLTIKPQLSDVGVYHIGIKVYDESHHAYDRQTLMVAIKDPANINPVLTFPTTFELEATEQNRFEITAFDEDQDSILYSIDSQLSFAHLEYIDQKVYLDIQPRIEDEGVYQIAVTADDCYGSPTTRYLALTVLPTTLTPGRLLYRINFGGPEIADSTMNWMADIDREATYGTTHFLRTGSWFFKGVNNTSAPNSLFGPYRYDGPEGIEMQFAFPLPGHGVYHVKLYFAERQKEVDEGITAVFDVAMEGQKLLDHFNIYQNAQMEAYELNYDIEVIDGALNLDFTQIENKDKINGIEISYKSDLVVNQKPKIQTDATVNINENEVFSLPVYVSDDHFEGSDSLSLVLLNAPDFVQFNAVNAGEYAINFQPTYQDAGTYNSLELVASDGLLTDTLSLSLQVNNVNRLPSIDYIEPQNVEVGSSLSLDIQAQDEDGDSLSLQLVNPLPFLSFSDLGNGHASLQIDPLHEHIGNYDLEITAEDALGGISSSIITVQVYERPAVDRIPLNTSMITDLVSGGSRKSPDYLVDEQDLDPILNQHPSSRSWIPSRTSSGTYESMIDLGQEYYIDFAMLHDMRNSGDLHISIGEPGNWTEITSLTTSSLKVWAKLDLQIQSRYLLLSMVNTVDAQINEIALYGYAADAIPDATPNTAPIIDPLEDVRMMEGESISIPVHLQDDFYRTCNNLSLNLASANPFITISKIDSVNYSLLLFPSTGDAGDYSIDLVSSDGCLESSLSLLVSVSTFNAANNAPLLDALSDVSVEVGNPINLNINSSDVDGDQLYLYTVNAPNFVILSDLSNGLGNLSINPTDLDVGNYSMEVMVEDQFGASASTSFNIEVKMPPASERIVLNSNMITDLVSGGSLRSPDYLVDEQSLDPLLNEHPISKSWVPLRRSTSGTFETIIDLGQEYYIDYAMLHDMRNTGDLHISIGEPGNWTEVAINTTSSLKVWNQVDLQLKTRYLLLSMINTVYAQINEIALYGYPINMLKRSSFYEALEDNIKYTIYPNPSSDYIRINNKKEEQEVEIYNLSGVLVSRTQDSKIDIASWTKGLYFLRIIDQGELVYQGKFLKMD